MFESLTDSDQHRIRADLRIAITGAVIAAILMGGVELLIGNVGDWEARTLIQAAVPTLRVFASTVMIVTSSALALMLTIMGLTGNADREIRGGHFERIRQIGFAAAVVFIATAFLFTILIVSPTEMDGVPVGWNDVIYFSMTGLSAIISGAVVGIVILIYTAVRDIATTFGPGDETPLLEDTSHNSDGLEDEIIVEA